MNFKKMFLLLLILVSSGLSYSQINEWSVAMSGYKPYNGQSYKKSSIFPKEWIKEKWDEDYDITEVAYGDGQWVVVMTGESGYYGQSWTTSSSFPEDWIDEKWNEGKDITSIAYGDGQWAVVMSKGTNYHNQQWSTRSSIDDVESVIDKGWEEGKRITSIAYGNNKWVVIMSKGTGLGRQTYKYGSTYPSTWIQNKFDGDDDYDVTEITAGDGIWFTVMSSSIINGQSTNNRTSFPKDFIKEKWDNKDYFITNITYFDNKEIPYIPVVTHDPKIHFLLFVDTDDSRIGGPSEKTKRYFQNTFIPGLKNSTSMDVETNYYYGSRFTLSNLESAINGLDTNEGDVIFFYFVGHGYNRDESDFPTVTLGISGQSLSSRQIDLINIYNTLKKKDHRLLVTMAEACNVVYASRNNFKSGTLIANAPPYEFSKRRLKELFEEGKGDYLISSSKKNQLSHLATDQPGFFTCAFRDAIGYLAGTSYSKSIDWEDVFYQTRSNTEGYANEIGEDQIPQLCTGYCN